MSYHDKILEGFFIKPVSIEKVDDEGMFFSDGTVLSDYHSQDCCENVYADWNYANDESLDRIKQVKRFVVYIVPNSGIRIVFFNDEEEKHPIFIPCYNSQNGYYNSDLDLIFGTINSYVKTQISEACFENYC